MKVNSSHVVTLSLRVDDYPIVTNRVIAKSGHDCIELTLTSYISFEDAVHKLRKFAEAILDELETEIE